MKANRAHRVPLSKRALEVLAEAAELSDSSGLVFPGMRSGRPLSENLRAKPLRELRFGAVTHGFRSSFRDYAAEQTRTPHAVMEAALAHAVWNKAEAAYARSDLFDAVYRCRPAPMPGETLAARQPDGASPPSLMI